MSVKQRQHPCSRPPTNSANYITANAFRVSFMLIGKFNNGFLTSQSWRVLASPADILRTTTEKTVISHDFFGVSAIHEARIWNDFAYMKIFSGRINSRKI